MEHETQRAQQLLSSPDPMWREAAQEFLDGHYSHICVPYELGGSCTQPHPVEQAKGSPFFDTDGFFKSPVLAAAHAVMVQGGYSTPERECARMLKDGGRHAEIARAWMAEKGITEEDLAKEG